MKKLIIIFLLSLISCDPPRINPFTLNYVGLNIEVASYNRFVLGDTLKIRITIPDSLEYNYYENGIELKKKIFVSSIQEAVAGAFIYKFDTLNTANGGIASYRDDDLNFSYKITDNLQNRPFYREQIIIPKTKGVFFAEFRGSPANKIKVNNNFEAQLSVFLSEKVSLGVDMY